MPFGVVSGVGRGMDVYEDGRQRGRGVLGVNLGRPIVYNGDGGALFPNYFWGVLVIVKTQQSS